MALTVVTSNLFPDSFDSGVLKLLPDSCIRSDTFSTEDVEIWRQGCTREIHEQVFLYDLRKGFRGICPDIVHLDGAFSSVSIQCLLLQRALGYKMFVDGHSHELMLESRGAAKMTLTESCQADIATASNL